MPSTILACLRATARQSDHTLTHLSRLLSTTAGVEASLTTLFYALALLHSQLTRVLTQRYERLADRLVSQASRTMLPGETLVAAIEPPHLGLREACAGVRTAAETVNDARMFLRLKGLVDLYVRAKGMRGKPPRDAIVKTLLWGQLGAQAAYQVLENGAFLANKGVLRAGRWKVREAGWWKWSTRFWMAYVSLEMMRLLRVRQLRFNEDFGAQKTEGGEHAVQAQSAELERNWTRQLIANVGWIIPTLNWNVQEEGLPPAVGLAPDTEAWLGVSGLLPGVLALQDAWRESGP